MSRAKTVMSVQVMVLISVFITHAVSLAVHGIRTSLGKGYQSAETYQVMTKKDYDRNPYRQHMFTLSPLKQMWQYDTECRRGHCPNLDVDANVSCGGNSTITSQQQLECVKSYTEDDEENTAFIRLLGQMYEKIAKRDGENTMVPSSGAELSMSYRDVFKNVVFEAWKATMRAQGVKQQNEGEVFMDVLTKAELMCNLRTDLDGKVQTESMKHTCMLDHVWSPMVFKKGDIEAFIDEFRPKTNVANMDDNGSAYYISKQLFKEMAYSVKFVYDDRHKRNVMRAVLDKLPDCLNAKGFPGMEKFKAKLTDQTPSDYKDDYKGNNFRGSMLPIQPKMHGMEDGEYPRTPMPDLYPDVIDYVHDPNRTLIQDFDPNAPAPNPAKKQPPPPPKNNPSPSPSGSPPVLNVARRLAPAAVSSGASYEQRKLAAFNCAYNRRGMPLQEFAAFGSATGGKNGNKKRKNRNDAPSPQSVHAGASLVPVAIVTLYSLKNRA